MRTQLCPAMPITKGSTASTMPISAMPIRLRVDSPLAFNEELMRGLPHVRPTGRTDGRSTPAPARRTQTRPGNGCPGSPRSGRRCTRHPAIR
ncbi:hypothetical protein G6F22_022018 [Rhizopus arrhizus]|nr:hypothetical protein G6F22_022018 [Rhizopus arrhizus]